MMLFLFLSTFLGLTCTLVGLYYDDADHAGIRSLGDCLMPLVLHELFLLFALVLAVRDSVQLLGEYLRGTRIVSSHREDWCDVRVVGRLICSWLIPISVLLLFLVVLNLFYESFLDALDLSTALVSLVLIVFGLQVLYFDLTLDESYAW